MRVDEEQHEGEADLGGNIEDGVRNDLGVNADLVGALGQAEDNGLGSPEYTGHATEEGVETQSLPGAETSGCKVSHILLNLRKVLTLETVEDQDVEDTEEEGAADTEE